RDPLKFDMAAVMDSVSRHGVTMEINCQIERLDLNDSHARAARERGIPLVISTDAHSVRALSPLEWGVPGGRRACGPAGGGAGAPPRVGGGGRCDQYASSR